MPPEATGVSCGQETCAVGTSLVNSVFWQNETMGLCGVAVRCPSARGKRAPLGAGGCCCVRRRRGKGATAPGAFPTGALLR